MPNKTDLSKYNNSWYNPGGNFILRTIWYFTNVCFFKSSLPVNSIKVFLLKLFGAKIGKNVVIKPHVSIKYPWNLQTGNNIWIGENVWIDNLGKVIISDNVCISQGAMLLCGNHNYKKETFDLIVKDIIIEKGAWIGAKSVVCPGVKVGAYAMLTVNSVATKDLENDYIYTGNPAQKLKLRVFES